MSYDEQEFDKFKIFLKEFYNKNDDNLRQAYDRSLSFQDGMFDRWERAKRLEFGEGTSIYNSSQVFGTVTVGENTWIGPNTILDGSGGGLSIGDFCSISSGVQIYTHDTVLNALSSGKQPTRKEPTSVGSNCYIGSGTIITCGVHIADKVVIAANSTVTKSIPSGWVVGGSPAKKIGEVVFTDGEYSVDYTKR